MSFSRSQCTCKDDGKVLVISKNCVIHGVGTAYWDKVSRELENPHKD